MQIQIQNGFIYGHNQVLIQVDISIDAVQIYAFLTGIAICYCCIDLFVGQSYVQFLKSGGIHIYSIFFF